MSFDNFNKRYPILVPYWVLNQLERNKLPLSTVLNLEKMLTISSTEDLAIMLNMNSDPAYQRQFFGESTPNGLSPYWNDYYHNQCQRLSTVIPLTKGHIEDRLFTTDVNVTPVYPNAFDIKGVTSDIASCGVLLVIVYPGYFGGTNAAHIQRKLVREYLKQSYVYVGYDAVARDPLFSQYLKTTVSGPA